MVCLCRSAGRVKSLALQIERGQMGRRLLLGATVKKITARIDNITAIRPEYASATPPAPHSVKVELTARCDFKCFFCASHQRLRGKSDMSIESFEALAKELHGAGVKELGLFYLGESFILRDLAEYVKIAKDIGFEYIFLTTNGLKSTPERLESVFKAGLDSLKFSVNWADEAQFSEVTGMPGKLFYAVLNNIKTARTLARSMGSECGIYASSIMYDGDQQERMQSLVEEHVIPYVDEHYYLPLYNQGALTSDVSIEHGFIPTAGNQGRVGALRKPLPCWSAFTEGHVTFDGKLSACCFDHSDAWTMGDLNTTPFMEAWHSERFQKLRTEHLAENVKGTPCEKCVAWS